MTMQWQIQEAKARFSELIQKAIDDGKLGHDTVTVESLVAAGLCSKPRDGVKILGAGEITAKLAFEVAAASKSAIAAIEGAGGSVKVLRVAKVKADAEA